MLYTKLCPMLSFDFPRETLSVCCKSCQPGDGMWWALQYRNV